MKRTLIAMAVVGGMMTPALAFSMDDIKCSAFTAMDSKGQMAAIDSIKMADEKMASDKMAGDKMAGDKMAGDKMAGDKMAGDKMAGDKMAGDKMAGDKMAADKMSGDKMDTDMETAAGGAMMSTDDLTKQVSTYCTDHPDMMVSDAL